MKLDCCSDPRYFLGLLHLLSVCPLFIPSTCSGPFSVPPLCLSAVFICHLFFLSSHHPTSHLPSCYLAFFPSLCLISQVFPPLIATLVTPPELLFSFCFLLSSTSASLPTFYTHTQALLLQLTPLSAFTSWENATSVLTRRLCQTDRLVDLPFNSVGVFV